MSNSKPFVPGLHNERVTIQSINPRVLIMRSKQMPRKVSILASDGNLYGFLLKAHEDTRLDERIMQMFNFITDIVCHSSVPLANRLNIKSYKVLPLTSKVGLIGWVPNTQTPFEVISQHRTANNVPADIEMNRSYALLPKYDSVRCRFPMPLQSPIAQVVPTQSAHQIQRLFLSFTDRDSSGIFREMTVSHGTSTRQR
jgi:FKBP12-rapamycin complex-associated protein